ncbi:iron-containing redox enzyme family protein [Actinomadura darangshiensis]|uniref:Iron-containing redox enzyme family protein n=1 Tax=Actinomadura darangshiensis TaxID=705336 RepID=A0A4R4ZLM0_9ACTN|nr:iron-containing redox enzyme family protein [Actinomadura darangshiensis]TDD59673.1 iron-containing redox enzyme family protein [Actinomadura darangshiensis]
MTVQSQESSAGRQAGDTLGRRLAAFAGSPLFRGDAQLLHGPNPYRRMLVPGSLAEHDFDRPPGPGEWSAHRSLAAHRLLGTYYESETVLLPEQGLAGLYEDFDLFYGRQLKEIREGSVSELERFAFACLDDAVDVSGAATPDVLDAYFQHVVDEAAAGPSPALTAIAEARDRESAADLYLVQLALDGLTEASAMSRNLGGAYGPEQSALFKIFIDEFGYGVYDAKHTTIFAKMLRSRAMATHVHAYWNFYLAGPLATNNYYYYLSRDHAKFFRYAGAVTYAEAVFAPAFVEMVKVFRDIFGDAVDLHYCDEHAHIDEHHGRITREQVLLALAERHGPRVVPELLRGVAEARLIGGWFEDDTAAQIRWSDDLPRHRELAGSAKTAGAPQRTLLTPESPFGTRTHDDAVVLEIERGEADLVTTPTGPPERMARGDAVLIPAGRLYGVRPATSETACLLHTATPG